jgi:SARP family transcriptional regulator, regulator of embCAB operon
VAIRVSLTERVEIEADGVRVDEERFPGRQGRLLFAYLLTEQGRPVPRDELADALWDGELPATWVKALAVLVSKLRALLEECGVDGAAITSAFGCYKLTLPEGSWVDVTASEDAVERAEAALADGRHAEARSAATTAVGLAGRRFLPGEDGLWVEEKRRRLQRLLLRALECNADAAVGSGHAAESLRSAEQLVALEPFRESGHRRLMQAHIAAGNNAEALTVYERCRHLLADELGAYPSPEIESLYLEILRAPARPPSGQTLEPAPQTSGAEHEAADGAPGGLRRPLGRAGLLLATLAGTSAVAIAGFVYAGRDDAEPPARAMAGAWAAVDHDGSNQTMQVTRASDGVSYAITLEDEDAQACGGGPVTGEGAGTPVEGGLSATISLTCATGAKLEFPYPLTYRATDDTIVDPVGVVWSRRTGSR